VVTKRPVRLARVVAPPPHPMRGEEACGGCSSSSPMAAIVVTHPRLLGEVGGAANSSIIRRRPVVPVRGEIVSSYCIMLLNHITHHYLSSWNPGRTRERTGEEVVVAEDEDQRCRTMVDGRPGTAVRRFRNARTSFGTTLRPIER